MNVCKEFFEPADCTETLPAIRAALAQFAQARDYARDVGGDPWEFAVEIDRLVALGLTTSDLRWLIRKGYVLHAREMTGLGDRSRRFEASPNLAFSPASCFLLADAAEVLVANDSPSPLRILQGVFADCDNSLSKGDLRPRWDSEDRTLYVGSRVVKEYRVRSPNQEAVLAAFEEESWPHYVDDPLPPVADQNPKLRLRDTIKCLNANQRNSLIRFRGDGTGERIRWELTEDRTVQLPAIAPPMRRAA